MKYIIKLESSELGCRPPVQSWGNGDLPTGFAFIQESQIQTFALAKGFVNITVENGIVTAISENTAAKTAWEEANQPTPPQPTPQEEIEALKIRAQAAEDALLFLMDNGGM